MSAIPGESDKVYQHYLHQVFDALRNRGDLPGALKEARRTFDDVALSAQRRQAHRGGGRRNLHPGQPVLQRKRRAGDRSSGRRSLDAAHRRVAPLRHPQFQGYGPGQPAVPRTPTVCLEERFQIKDEHRLEKIFEGSIKNLEEPSIPETLEMAKDYLHPSFEGEAILSMGKSHDFVRKGACGLVNIMPFTCMPGTVVNSLFKRFREDHDNIPFLNLAYDGQEQTHTRTRLEAFMYQVRQFKARKA